MKLKLTQKNQGSRIAVGLHGEENDILDRFNSFWNHGATSGELHWQTAGNAYFWTTEKDLKKAILNATLFELWNNHPEMEEDDREAEALTIAKIENNPKLLTFNKAVSVENIGFHSIGTIKAEKPDTDYANRESL